MASKKKTDPLPSTGEVAAPSGPAVTGNATQPDEVSEAARLGGQNVSDLKAEPENQEPAAAATKTSSSGDMRLIPNDAALLVGNSYTATMALPDSFDPDTDTVTFQHPNGWDVKAAVNDRVASGTFLIERERSFTFGFKVNGKKAASATYETRTA